MHVLLLSFFIVAGTYAAPVTNDESNPCITSCSNRPNGDYQSCHGCHVYASCSGSFLYDNRPCPSNLVWDDDLKMCTTESSTCKDVKPDPSTPEPSRPTTTNVPEKSTSPQDEGKMSTTPEERVIYVDVSNTNAQNSKSCITSCEGLGNGDYQSCKGCSVYATCNKGHLFDNRPCPSGLLWDDARKRCLYVSSTCKEEKPQTSTTLPPTKSEVSGESTTPEASMTTTPIAEETTSGAQMKTGVKCVDDCAGRENGDYQSCYGCDVYASCIHGFIIDGRFCPAGLVWDDNLKQCARSSATCKNAVPATTQSSTTSMKPEITTTAEPEDETTQAEMSTAKTTSKMTTTEEAEMTTAETTSKMTTTEEAEMTTAKTTSKMTTTAEAEMTSAETTSKMTTTEEAEMTTAKTTSKITTTEEAEMTTTEKETPEASTTNPETEQTTQQVITTTMASDSKDATTESVTTTEEVAAQSPCISSCVGLKDGNYQSCEGCQVFASCVSDRLFDNRPCPSNLVWDDASKKCLNVSTTCNPQSTTTTPVPETTVSDDEDSGTGSGSI